MMNFSAVIRKNMGDMTQKTLSKRTLIPIGTIYGLLNGTCNLKAGQTISICEVLKIDIDQFFEDAKNEPR